MMSKPDTARFAPIPVRAIGDDRLAAIHFRILAAIAAHDRMSGPRAKGAGCYASNMTLAKACGVHPANFSTAVNELGRWGYIQAEPHPLNKRTRVYRVAYDPLPVGKPNDADTLPDDKASTATSSPGGDADHLPSENDQTEIVCPEKEQPNEVTEESDDNIFCRNRKISSETETYSLKGHTPLRVGDGLMRNGAADNDGASLAMIERLLKDGGIFDQQSQAFVEGIIHEREPDHPLFQQARRILETWGPE